MLAVLAAAFLGCSTTAPSRPEHSQSEPLRVGVTADSAPFVTREGGRLVGLEVDFARELSQVLGRPLQLIAMAWSDQIPSLIDGRTDIIMSGMTVTRAREVQIAFSSPYLRSGLVPLVRRQDVRKFPSRESVCSPEVQVGVVDATTGARFVREHCGQASISTYPTATAAVSELLQRRIDVFVHDAPMVAWWAAKDEASLTMLLKPLDDEPLAWGMRRDDDALRGSVDAALARWRSDGTRDRILSRWLPHWQELEQAVERGS
jgi:ABC-type amino acid transport substrate-binding protein